MKKLEGAGIVEKVKWGVWALVDDVEDRLHEYKDECGEMEMDAKHREKVARQREIMRIDRATYREEKEAEKAAEVAEQVRFLRRIGVEVFGGPLPGELDDD